METQTAYAVTAIDDPFPTPLIAEGDEQEPPRDEDAITDEEREWLDGLIDTYKHTTVYDAIVVCPCP
jgi:hypothetical protein